MTKIDIISGFLGAGKTTLINKLIKEGYNARGEKIVLIENEFGDIGIDGGFLKEAGINITEMNSGCICCSLVGDFGDALRKVIAEYAPDRVLIEPSGVGKLSDVIKAVHSVETRDAKLNSYAVVVDASKCKIYMKNFGEFFNDQIEHASCIILSHTDKAGERRLSESIELVRAHNEKARLVTTEWDKLSAEDMIEAMEGKNSLEAELSEMLEHEHEHHHEHHHHEHHHHDHDEHCDCGCHDHDHEHHHHDHDEHCDCGCHDHDHHGHHHHHHADEVFTSWGRETVRTFSVQELEHILDELFDEKKYGYVLRAKGIVASSDGEWIHFDYVPGEPDIRRGASDVIGKICVIGSKLNEAAISELFGVK